MSYKTIDPIKIPEHTDEVKIHQGSPSTVRHFVKNLPEGASLYYFNKIVLGYTDLDIGVHFPLCFFLEHNKYGRYRDATVPRSWFKTSTATVGKSIWLPIKRDQNMRILIAMNTADNAQKRVHLIKHHWENNKILKESFPEFVPDFKHCRWSNQCADIKRSKYTEEGTYEAIGSGGAVVSRHYDHIIEDDLVFAKKDDLGTEIMPNQEDIEKAIGWHKLVYSLFSDPSKSTLDSIGTRWAVNDLKAWIKKNEAHKFRFFQIDAEQKDKRGRHLGVEYPVWPKRFGTEVLRDLLQSQGPSLYYTQYLNLPRDPKDALFNVQWLQNFHDDIEIPKPYTTATFVDLALWGDSNSIARNIVLTLARDWRNNIWILRYDRGKYNPTEVIQLMETHSKLYDSHVYVEEVYYQKALRHFALERMERTGYTYMISPLKRDSGSGAKDNRIKSIQGFAFNHMIHVRPEMSELKKEFNDYPNGITCDILDCIGYATQQKLPLPPNQPEDETFINPFSLESILESVENNGRNTQYPFSIQCGRSNNGKWYS